MTGTGALHAVKNEGVHARHIRRGERGQPVDGTGRRSGDDFGYVQEPSLQGKSGAKVGAAKGGQW